MVKHIKITDESFEIEPLLMWLLSKRKQEGGHCGLQYWTIFLEVFW